MFFEILEFTPTCFNMRYEADAFPESILIDSGNALAVTRFNFFGFKLQECHAEILFVPDCVWLVGWLNEAF